MPLPFVISLPADDVELKNELIEKLEPYADVQEEPPTFIGIAEVKLIVLITAGLLAGASQLSTLIKNILDLKDRFKKKDQVSKISIGKLGEPPIPLEDIDEETLSNIIKEKDSEKIQ